VRELIGLGKAQGVFGPEEIEAREGQRVAKRASIQQPRQGGHMAMQMVLGAKDGADVFSWVGRRGGLLQLECSQVHGARTQSVGLAR
jgi:hypothetical protein